MALYVLLSVVAGIGGLVLAVRLIPGHGVQDASVDEPARVQDDCARGPPVHFAHTVAPTRMAFHHSTEELR